MAADPVAPRRSVPPTSGVCINLRPTLAAGLAFMQAAQATTRPLISLVGWLDDHLVAPRLMTMPEHVHEPGVSPVPLGRISQTGAAVFDARAERILSTARVRVAVMLGGLLATPADDRFLAGAIFAGRVTRTTVDQARIWQPSPKPDDRLSDIALACFAADILDHRDEHQARLCVCDMCGTVSFPLNPTDRRRCATHGGAGA
jgi:hypothetical protein